MSSSGSAPLQIGLSIRQRSPPPLIISLSSGNVLIFSPKLLRHPRTSSRSRRSVDFLSPIKVEPRPTDSLPLFTNRSSIHLPFGLSVSFRRFYLPVSSSRIVTVDYVSIDFIAIDNASRGYANVTLPLKKISRNLWLDFSVHLLDILYTNYYYTRMIEIGSMRRIKTRF